MKPIRLIIVAIFVLSALLSYLLYQKKAGRVQAQLHKKELGWNAVAIRKMVISEAGKDTLILTKQNGVWQSNTRFDGMGFSNQLLIYLSTMQIAEAKTTVPPDAFLEPLQLTTFDKNGKQINTMALGNEEAPGSVFALLNDSSQPVILSSPQNTLSLRGLLQVYFEPGAKDKKHPAF